MAQDLEPAEDASTRTDNVHVAIVAIIITLGNLALCIHRSSRVYMYQQSQCLQYYLVNDPTKINDAWEIEESLCKISEVQSPLSMIEGLDTFLQLLPAVLVLATCLKLLPKVGLRRLLILNLAFVGCEIFLATGFFGLHRPWTITAMLLTPLCDLLGGGDLTRITLGLTVVSQLLPPERLTNVNNYISASFILASFVGSATGSLLLTHHIYILNAIGVACAVLGVGVATTCLPSELGQESAPSKPAIESEIGLLDDDETDSDVDSTLAYGGEAQQDTQNVPQILLSSWKSSFMSLVTLFQVPNPTFTALWIYFLYALSTVVTVLYPQYISLSLHWPLATVNALLAAKTLTSAALLIALPTFRRRYLEPRMDSQTIDLLIIQASLALNFCGMTGYGFPLPAPFFITALFLYTAGNGVQDSLATYGRSTLPASENPADFFVRGGLVQLIAGLIGSVCWTMLFSLCLSKTRLPIGLPFWVSGGLLAITLGLVRSLKGQAVYRSVTLK